MNKSEIGSLIVGGIVFTCITLKVYLVGHADGCKNGFNRGVKHTQRQACTNNVGEFVIIDTFNGTTEFRWKK